VFSFPFDFPCTFSITCFSSFPKAVFRNYLQLSRNISAPITLSVIMPFSWGCLGLLASRGLIFLRSPRSICFKVFFRATSFVLSYWWEFSAYPHDFILPFSGCSYNVIHWFSGLHFVHSLCRCQRLLSVFFLFPGGFTYTQWTFSAFFTHKARPPPFGRTDPLFL